MNTIPLPPKQSGELTDNEISFILEATLKPKDLKNTKTIAFIDAFVRCRNIAQSSNEAGLTPKEGYRLRHRKDISNAIQKITEKSINKYGFDASEVVERVKEVVDFDPIELMNPDGTFKSNLHAVRPEARRCLKKMKVKNLYQQVEDMNGIKSQIIIGELIEYEFYDKIKSAELVGREKDLFKNTTRVEHDVTKDMASVLLASAKRADDQVARLNSPDIVDAEVVEKGNE